jgi:hypothetical protein
LKTPFSFLEQAARNEVRQTEKIADDELGLSSLKTENLAIFTAIEGISQSKKI